MLGHILSTVLLSAVTSSNPVFIDPEHAIELLDAGATVLDARGLTASAPFLPNATTISWLFLRDGPGRTGRLAPLDRLRAAFEAVGVRSDQAVLIYGAAADGWGEEGRIWWTLRYLNHRRVFILDGGIHAWLRSRLPTADETSAPKPGQLSRRIVPRLRARFRELRAASKRLDVAVLDARSHSEFSGATPYLSSHGGHIPSAKHLDWRDLLDPDGRLRPPALLRQLLESRGVQKEKRVIAYCTGGVRSAFLIAVLAHLGYPDIANYDGSWWEWSSQPELHQPHP